MGLKQLGDPCCPLCDRSPQATPRDGHCAGTKQQKKKEEADFFQRRLQIKQKRNANKTLSNKKKENPFTFLKTNFMAIFPSQICGMAWNFLPLPARAWSFSATPWRHIIRSDVAFKAATPSHKELFL